MRRLFTDFDGPIMDVSERYYQVYLYCLARIKLPNQLVNTLTKAEFWHCKRSQIPETEIALKSGLTEYSQPERFAKLRRNTVHTEPYFKYDRLNEMAIAALEQAQAEGLELAVMTMRRVCELDPAIEAYDLGRFFPPERRFCLANDYVKTQDVQDKTRSMANALKTLPQATSQWMVGDTEADIIAGKTHGIYTIGVLSGIRSQERLELNQPEKIVNNLAEAVALIAAT
ncbi:HAD family hydrolase [Thalassoporum mexicanum]|uniref:HAD family hydrolase n=1 Tax=Thalassoporum mexicanum TaxID=3457544 RepID=UPI0005A14C63